VNFTSTRDESSSPAAASPVDLPSDSRSRAQTNEELNEVLRALAIPFDLAVVQRRVTEWSDDGTRGPYADARAYSDRLNDLFTPAGWSRKYTVQASAPVQASEARAGSEDLVHV
jgi:hypothetical protein